MRKHNYVVGYTGEGQCAYGKRGLDEGCGWVNLMTLNQAQTLSKEIVSLDGKKISKSVVYKLVEVKP